MGKAHQTSAPDVEIGGPRSRAERRGCQRRFQLTQRFDRRDPHLAGRIVEQDRQPFGGAVRVQAPERLGRVVTNPGFGVVERSAQRTSDVYELACCRATAWRPNAS